MDIRINIFLHSIRRNHASPLRETHPYRTAMLAKAPKFRFERANKHHPSRGVSATYRVLLQFSVTCIIDKEDRLLFLRSILGEDFSFINQIDLQCIPKLGSTGFHRRYSILALLKRYALLVLACPSPQLVLLENFLVKSHQSLANIAQAFAVQVTAYCKIYFEYIYLVFKYLESYAFFMIPSNDRFSSSLNLAVFILRVLAKRINVLSVARKYSKALDVLFCAWLDSDCDRSISCTVPTVDIIELEICHWVLLNRFDKNVLSCLLLF